jgi:colanic acid biosynthesis glycosyl transferase WcaI
MEATFSLALLLTWAVRPAGNWDVVLYVGAQPSIGLVARLIAAVRHIPYAVEVTDIASTAASETGVVRSEFLLRLLSRIEREAYRKAAGIMVLCGAFKSALVESGYPAHAIAVIRSPVDTDKIRPGADPDPFRSAWDLSREHFVVLWSGSMGVKQDLQTPLQTAALLRGSHPSIRWVLVGEGELKSTIVQSIERHGLEDRVRLLSLQEEDRLAGMYAAADLLLLCQLRSMRTSVIPSKLLTYMAAGKPVVAAVDSSSEAARLIIQTQGGAVAAPQDPVALANCVVALMEDQARRAEAGSRNRQRAVAEFDSHHVWAAQEAFLKSLCVIRQAG